MAAVKKENISLFGPFYTQNRDGNEDTQIFLREGCGSFWLKRLHWAGKATKSGSGGQIKVWSEHPEKMQ